MQGNVAMIPHLIWLYGMTLNELLNFLLLVISSYVLSSHIDQGRGDKMGL